jgi:hypothetical protein
VASLGALVIELAANTARLQGDLGKAVNMAQGAARRFTGIFRGVAALAGASSLGAVVARSIQMGDELNKAAIKAGVSGRTISELAHAAKMADVELGALSNSLRFMQVNLSKAATGAKEPRQALAALGLTIDQLAGKSADLQFETIAQQISQLTDPADKARVATELFGRAGADLLPLFEQGAAGIRRAREEAQKLGVSFSDQQIKKLADADDATKRLKASWEGFATSLTSKVAPALSSVLDLLSGQGFQESSASKISGLELAIKRLEAPNKYKLSDGQIADRARRLAALKNELAEIRNAELNRTMPSGAAATAPGYEATINGEETLTEIIVTHAKIRRDAMDEYYDSLNERTQTEMERQISFLDQVEAELQVLRDEGRITADQYAERWQEALDSVLQKIEPVGQRIGQIAKKPIVDITEFAKQAARNMQDAFAQFLFDPFKDGLKGMLKGFIDTIRRMIAEMAAAKLFASMDVSGGIAGGIGKLLGFANGGSFRVGGSGGTDSQLVAFKATPGEMVNVRTPGQASSSKSATQITIHVDARGAQQGVAQQLQALLPAVVREAVNQSLAIGNDRRSRGYA